MRTSQNFGIYFILLLVIQIILSNYFQLSPYFVVSILPAIIFCIPLTVSTITCMIIAFAASLSVDFLSEGLLGINAAACLPIAWMRIPIIRLFLGEDLIVRKDSFNFKKNGTVKILMCILFIQTIFLLIYILLDGAGTRPLWFNLTRFGISLVINTILSMIVTGILTPDDRI